MLYIVLLFDLVFVAMLFRCLFSYVRSCLFEHVTITFVGLETILKQNSTNRSKAVLAAIRRGRGYTTRLPSVFDENSLI